MNERLLFSNLLKQALSEWPGSLEIVLQTEEFDSFTPTDKGYDLVRYKNLPWNKDLDNYIVKDLYEFYDDIEGKYMCHPDEVLMRELHSVLYWTIKDLAKYVVYIEIKNLRPEIIQNKFEKSRKECLDNEEKYRNYRWKDEDFQLVRDYFSVNYPEGITN